MAAMNPSDAELIQKILTRDEAAFDVLYHRYAEKVRLRLRRIVREDSLAEDLVQEAFLRVWSRAEQWRGTGSFSGWLSRLTTNLALNYLRSIRRRREYPLDVPKPGLDAEEEEDAQAPSWMIDVSALDADVMVALREEREIARRLVDQLPEEQQEVIRLVVDEEMDIRSAADRSAGFCPMTRCRVLPMAHRLRWYTALSAAMPD